MQDDINSLCPEDRRHLQKFFDRWKVGHGGRGNPTTDYEIATTNFRHAYFADEKYSTFLHEFRHLMPKNKELDPGPAAYARHHFKRTTHELAIEKDADDFAGKIINGCRCGDLR